MEEAPVFDHEKVQVGIECVCESMDYVGLTLFERWWVAYHIEKAAAAMLGDKLGELAEKWDVKPGDGEAEPTS